MVMGFKRPFSTPTEFLLCPFTAMVRVSFQVLKSHENISINESVSGTGSDDEVGEGEGKGYSVNVPLLEGITDQGYNQLFGPLLCPVPWLIQASQLLIELQQWLPPPSVQST